LSHKLEVGERRSLASHYTLPLLRPIIYICPSQLSESGVGYGWVSKTPSHCVCFVKLDRLCLDTLTVGEGGRTVQCVNCH